MKTSVRNQIIIHWCACFLQLLVLKYVQNKDVFMRYHKAHLTRRLILDISADSEIEENMVEWLRVRILFQSFGSHVTKNVLHLKNLLTVRRHGNDYGGHHHKPAISSRPNRRLECQLTMSTNWRACFRTSRCRRISTSPSKKCISITSSPYQVTSWTHLQAQGQFQFGLFQK